MSKLLLIFYSLLLSLVPGFWAAEFVTSLQNPPIKPDEGAGLGILLEVYLLSWLTVPLFALVFYLILYKLKDKKFLMGFSITAWIVIATFSCYTLLALWFGLYGSVPFSNQ